MTDKHKAWCDLFDGQDICTCGLTELLDAQCKHGVNVAKKQCHDCAREGYKIVGSAPITEAELK